MRLFNTSYFGILYSYFILVACLVSAAVIPEAEPEITDLLFLDIHQATSSEGTTESKPLGTIVIGLFGKVVPNTVRNFKELAGVYSENHTPFHRVIPGFVIQAGDIDGKGGHSIYGDRGAAPPEGSDPTLFGPGYSGLEDENFEIHHDKIGRVSVANAGPNTGGSQFFICLDKLPHLDGHHVVFGQVLKGMDVAEAVAAVERNRQDKPIKEVFIYHARAEEYTDESQLNENEKVAGIEPIGSTDDTLSDLTEPVDESGNVQGTAAEIEQSMKDSAYSKDHPTGFGGSQHHYVFIPFVLFLAGAGFMAFKNKRNVAALIRGPRYRRV